MEQHNDNTKLATFAGGCFWCMEAPFEAIEGVKNVVSGYAGGETMNPSYEQVSTGQTGHYEAVQIAYDPQITTYETLLDTFWQQIDPTDAGGSFVDRGPHYRSAIFFHDPEQQRIALQSRETLENSQRFEHPVVTAIIPFQAFYPAEAYHQHFHSNNKARYLQYRRNSGRDQFISMHWPQTIEHQNGAAYVKLSPEKLKQQLSTLQYSVTQEEGTEPPFNNAYWDNKEEGLYVDIVSGEPLFSSRHKFDSATGWPSFSQAIAEDAITEHRDHKLSMTRTEIRSSIANSHLGHLFNDGPKPSGLRYCVNSAALRFIAKEDLEQQGYEDYRKYFS